MPSLLGIRNDSAPPVDWYSNRPGQECFMMPLSSTGEIFNSCSKVVKSGSRRRRENKLRKSIARVILNLSYCSTFASTPINHSMPNTAMPTGNFILLIQFQIWGYSNMGLLGQHFTTQKEFSFTPEKIRTAQRAASGMLFYNNNGEFPATVSHLNYQSQWNNWKDGHGRTCAYQLIEQTKSNTNRETRRSLVKEKAFRKQQLRCLR